MKIGILGTGMVGRAHAGKLVGLGHTVMIGTKDAKALFAETKSDAMGNPPFGAWHKEHESVKVGTFSEAARHGEMIINALKGQVALEVLKKVGESDLNNKILIDISNPLDFSKGMPPTLTVCNTDSLGEQIQRAFPKAKVVKTLNTLNAFLQVEPNLLANGDHSIFVSGNDAEAKGKVIQMLRDGYGWKQITDLGDIATARGSEMILPIWVSLMSALKTPQFNFKIVK